MTQTPNDNDLDARGWITPCLEVAVRRVTWLSDKAIAYRWGNRVRNASSDVKHVDSFVVACFLFELVFFLALALGLDTALTGSWIFRYVEIVAIIFCAWRAIDVTATAIRMALFDVAVASHARVVLLGLINYIEFCVCFAVFYIAARSHIHPPDKWDSFTPLYFSAVTQLTIGYGDVYPTGFARALAVLQAFVGVILLVLLVSRFISVMRTIRSLS